MSLTEISWDYIGTEHRAWKGKIKGIFSNLSFTLLLINRQTDHYLITSNKREIENEEVIGLETAKTKAQQILNSYILSHSIS